MIWVQLKIIYSAVTPGHFRIFTQEIEETVNLSFDEFKTNNILEPNSYQLCLQAVLVVVSESVAPACAGPSGVAVLRWWGMPLEGKGEARGE